MNAIYEAAKTGDLERIISLHERGPCLVVKIKANGDVQYLHKEGCVWDKFVVALAAHNGHLDCVQYLHVHGCPWNKEATCRASQNGHLDCLRYLHDNGCPWDHWATTFAAANGHLDCLQYLFTNGSEVNNVAAYRAAACNHLHCLRYLVENGCDLSELTSYTTALTAQFGQFDSLRYLIENGFPYVLPHILADLNRHAKRLDFEEHSWLRGFLFPHIEIMPQPLKDICQARHAQVELEKQALISELSDKLPLDVVKHCLHTFI